MIYSNGCDNSVIITITNGNDDYDDKDNKDNCSNGHNNNDDKKQYLA